MISVGMLFKDAIKQVCFYIDTRPSFEFSPLKFVPRDAIIKTSIILKSSIAGNGILPVGSTSLDINCPINSTKDRPTSHVVRGDCTQLSVLCTKPISQFYL